MKQSEDTVTEPVATAEPPAQGGGQAVTLTKNRTFEAHVGGQVFAFGPYECRKDLGKAVEHEDFKRLVDLGYFWVQEEKK